MAVQASDLVADDVWTMTISITIDAGQWSRIFKQCEGISEISWP